MADKRARGNNQKKDASRGGRSQASRKAPSRGPRQGSEPSRRGGVPRERAAVLAGDFIEGRRAAAEALRTGFPVKRALVADGQGSDAALARLIDDLYRANIPIKTVPRAQLDAISSHGAHQGIVLEVGSFPYAGIADIIARAGEGPALVLVLDHVTDDGNFGAIVRSAEVVGAAGVVIANKRAAGVTVGSYKTSAGAVMHLLHRSPTSLVRSTILKTRAFGWLALPSMRKMCAGTLLSRGALRLSWVPRAMAFHA